VMCGGSILSCCPRNPHGHERALKEENARCFFSMLIIHFMHLFSHFRYRYKLSPAKSLHASA